MTIAWHPVNFLLFIEVIRDEFAHGVTLLIAGPMLALTLKRIVPQSAQQAAGPAAGLFVDSNLPEGRLPGAFNRWRFCHFRIFPPTVCTRGTRTDLRRP